MFKEAQERIDFRAIRILRDREATREKNRTRMIELEKRMQAVERELLGKEKELMLDRAFEGGEEETNEQDDGSEM